MKGVAGGSFCVCLTGASENVAVAGEVSDGILKVTVTPKDAESAASFFVRVVIRK